MSNYACRPIVAGNWKMNCNPSEAKTLIQKIILDTKNHACEIVVCVPALDLTVASELLKNESVDLGAQNCHWENAGAFTGEISPSMLTSVGTKYVIIGHSERRSYFGETDQTVNKRVKSALNAGLRVILCVGETLAEYESGITFEHISKQIKLALLGVGFDNLCNVVIAYEPIWAIGTGKAASPEYAENVCSHIRKTVEQIYKQNSFDLRVIYGGSMNPENAHEFISQHNIDGGLIGGASLNAENFSKIVRTADSLKGSINHEKN